ncbi:MAG: PAS domain S-box protein [Deltaproteobacteria bacterium]|nr:PAS domain S-box protein [Deltaproteobacteria bacterium]
MISEYNEDHIEKIINALSQAAKGEYSARIDFASEDSTLGSVAKAVNTLLEKTDEKLSSISRLVEDLSANARRYQVIAERMIDVAWMTDMDLRTVYVSPSIHTVLGFSQEERMVQTIDEQLTPDSLSIGLDALARELALEKEGADPQRSATLVLEYYHKDGSTRFMETVMGGIRDEQGLLTGICGVSRDITDRKRVEEKLRKSEERYRMIVENMNEIIWIIGLDLQFTYVSPSSTWVTGYTPEEASNTPLDQLLTPESFAMATRRLADELALEESAAAPVPHRAITLEIEAIHKEGRPLWLEITGTFNRDTDGKITEILVVGRNISERKRVETELQESEKRYRMIVENMHEIIWVMDLNLKYKYRSPSNIRITGYSPEEITSIPAKDQIVPESYALVQTVLAEELEKEFGQEPVDPHRSRTIEVEVYHKDGGTVWIEVTGLFIRDDSGKPVEILLSAREITERKRAEEEKAKLESQLIQVQKMETVGRLAGGVAHDFNNMLGVILGYADLAKRSLAKAHPVLRNLVQIEKAATRSRDITAQLLAFSRKQIINPRVIDLNELVAHTQKLLIRLIGEHIELSVLPGEDLWTIKFDPSQIEQILINLAVNSRDAMPGGGKLVIETKNIILEDSYCKTHIGCTPGPHVRLSVSDNGEGMDKEMLQHIFEPFFTTKEVGQGTGLGLATVYGIIKQNNCSINVYSEPGYGTTFNIYVPRASGEREVREVSEEDPTVTNAGKILLVEDDPMLLDITQEMLESIGYTVIVAGAPREAISLFEQHDTSIDLVITDVIMPFMSGKELIDKLKEIRPDIKVLFMSGYTADAIAHHGVLEKDMHFLQKPFRVRDLARKVGEIMAAD